MDIPSACGPAFIHGGESEAPTFRSASDSASARSSDLAGDGTGGELTGITVAFSIVAGPMPFTAKHSMTATHTSTEAIAAAHPLRAATGHSADMAAGHTVVQRAADSMVLPEAMRTLQHPGQENAEEPSEEFPAVASSVGFPLEVDLV